MALSKLEHCLIFARDLEATKDFYVDVLGLRVGERPPFPFPGYWLYLGDRACIHLAPVAASDAQADYLGGREHGSGTGAIDHIAFTATDLAKSLDHLEAHGVEALRRDVPEQGAVQLFIQDPNGVTVELNFAAE